MAIKKSELYSFLWRSCDELRGGMDASLYKDYVLTLLFMKYVSDKYAGRPDALIEVPAGGGFADMIAAKGKSDVGEQINVIVGKLAEVNGLQGIINQADFDDDEKLGKGKEKVDRLSKLIGIFEDRKLDFSKNRADGDDLLGDAYEYLMRNFATESGKSKGQFYTPAEVSRIMAKVVGVSSATSPSQTIYDPTCGSGSLLLKAADETPINVTLYGQEKDIATRGLAVMNSVLHDHPSADIRQGNTLTSPEFLDDDGNLKRHDYVVANPPFSDKAWSNGLSSHNHFGRFLLGMPPAKNGDYAYLLHVLTSMKSDGKGCIVMPHGVLFRGCAEASIRRALVRRRYIKGIIGLPSNLFYGAGIPACLIVLDKAGTSEREGIFFVDASRGYIKDGNKNRLRSRDIHQIVDTFKTFSQHARYSRLVPFDEIETHDYNLNIPRYIDSTEPEDLQDIEAHLHGAIPVRDIDGLATYWDVCPDVRDTLFVDDRPGYVRLVADEADIRSTIYDHPEFQTFKQDVHDRFAAWRAGAVPRLQAIIPGDQPKELIFRLSEDLLDAFRGLPLVDHYAVYEHLMVYWGDVMQDDVYLIVADGWAKSAQLREIIVEKGEKLTETPDFALGKRKFKADLVPPALVVERFFAEEKAKVDALEASLSDLAQAMEELEEEHGGDDGLLEDARSDTGKITKKSLKDRLKQIRSDVEFVDEADVLKTLLGLMDREAEAKKVLKFAQASLDKKTMNQYVALTDDDVIDLVVHQKWLARIESDVENELDRVSQTLTSRVRTLAERYDRPVAQLVEDVETLTAKVDEHLRRMGFAV